MVGQDLNHSTFYLHLYDYKQSADTCLDQQAINGGIDFFF